MSQQENELNEHHQSQEQREQEDTDMDRRHWHFTRRISIGEVLTAAIILGAIYVKGNALIEEFRSANAQMDKRVTILEVRAEAQTHIDSTQDANTRDAQQRIEASLAEIQRTLRQQIK